MNLYELTGKYKELQMLAEEGQEGLDDTLESIDDAIENKLEQYAKVIKNIESDIEAIKAEKKRLNDKQQVLENSIKRLKDNAESSLKATGKSKVNAGTFTFAFRKNPHSVLISSDTIIPDDYKVDQAPKVDKKKILNDLKEGKYVPGAELKQDERLSIK